MSISPATASLQPSLLSNEQEHHSTQPSTFTPSPRCIRFTLFVGGVVIVFGLIVVLGWHTRNLAMVRMRTMAAPMYYNAALCFILSGIGLLAVASKWVRLAGLAGGVLGTFAGLTLSQLARLARE